MKKNEKIKVEILEKIQKIPVLEVVCQQIGISRMTLSRWRKEDQEFSKKIDAAISEGRWLINDLAESGLIAHIKDKNLPAIIHWLKVHHPVYGDKIEINTNIRTMQQLTPEQKKTIAKALRLAAFNKKNETKQTNPNSQNNHQGQSH